MKTSRLPISCTLLCLASALLTPSYAGKLDGVRSAVSGGSYRSSSSSSSSSDSRGGGRDDDDRRHHGRGYGRGHHSHFGHGFASPYYYGHAVSPFLWGGGRSIDVVAPDAEVALVDASLAPIPDPVPTFLAQLEYGVIDDDTDRFGFRGMFLYDQWTVRFGINRFEEDLGAAGTDSLDFYDLQFGMFLAGGEHGCFFASVGLQGLSDDYVDDVGILFEVGGALAPCDWVLMEASLGGGSIGEATISRARVDAGLVCGQFRAFLGYEHFEVEELDLGGPYFGFGLRF